MFGHKCFFFTKFHSQNVSSQNVSSQNVPSQNVPSQNNPEQNDSLQNIPSQKSKYSFANVPSKIILQNIFVNLV